MANKNSYEKKAQRKQLLSGTSASVTATKGNIKKSAVAMGTDIVVGGILGSIAGGLIGRGAFFIGMPVSGLGHYFGSPAATAFGVGMMATGGYKMAGLNGSPVSGMEGLKERFNAIKEDLKYKLFLDKIIRSKKPKEETTTEEGTNGMGEVQYFNHSNARELEGRVNFNALDHIERQIEASARQHANANNISGMEGMEGVEGIEGVEDYNF